LSAAVRGRCAGGVQFARDLREALALKVRCSDLVDELRRNGELSP